MASQFNSQTNNAPTIDFDAIKSLTTNEAKAVDQLIIDELSSDVVLINQIGHYIVNSGGKRLRPMLLLLAALFFYYLPCFFINPSMFFL